MICETVNGFETIPLRDKFKAFSCPKWRNIKSRLKVAGKFQALGFHKWSNIKSKLASNFKALSLPK